MAKKRLLTKLLVFLLTAALLLPSLFSLAQAAGQEAVSETTYVRKGIVTASGLNLREAPTTSSKILATLSRGTTVTILGESDEWFEVEYNAVFGYVHSSYVKIVNSTGIVTASQLNVRAEPTVNSLSIDKLPKGTHVEILEEVKSVDVANPVWFKISYFDGNTGYVSKDYIRLMIASGGQYRKVGVTTASALNVRSDSNVLSKSNTRLYRGSYVIIVEERTTKDFYKLWYKIDYGDNTGWVAAKYVDVLDWSEKPETTASTSSPSSGKNRNHNMSLACRTLSGTIVLPGEKFSWVKTMGSCNESKGYKIATVFSNGEIAEGFGGGVCQFSTTFNMAIKKLGISTNAHTHSLPVSYAKREDEASVSYPYVDFSFVNTTGKPILVEFVANKGTVVCNVYIAE